MTISNISSFITFLTNADTAVFTNAERLLSINNHYNDIHTLILRSQDEWDYDDSNNTDLPILTANTIANQQIYTLPTGTLKIKRLEVSFDGTNYHKAEPFDINERTQPTNTSALGDFSTSSPRYDVMSNTLWLYPIPSSAVSDGLKIWIERGPDEFTLSELTTGTKEPGFDSLFHDVIAYGTALDFCQARNLPQTDRIKQAYEEKRQLLINHYGQKQEDRIWDIQFTNTNYK